MVGNSPGGGQIRRVLASARAATVLVVTALTAGLSLTGCGTPTAASASVRLPDTAAQPGDPPVDSFYRIPHPLALEPPGSIIRSSPIASRGQLPAGSKAYRILYHSETIAGSDIAVSGMMVVPSGRPPRGGFPIVSWAHGTTGLASQCAPSVTGLSSIAYLDQLLKAKMIVVATDYQGLGTGGMPPYLVGQSEAQGVLDAARAARDLEGSTASNKVTVVGYSQGGQAALFAGQIAQTYAPELYLDGVVAIGPVSSISELAPPVPGTTTDADSGFAAMALYAWSATYRNLPLTSVLTTGALDHSALITASCAGPVGDVFDSVPTRLLFRPGWDSNQALRTDDATNQPGHTPIFAPVMVIQGTDDSLVPYKTTTRLVDGSLCGSEHDTVHYVPIAGATHSGALQQAGPTVLHWIELRLTGRAEVDSCAN
jgi:pimeloyl-ACP methyl ester carboxylesterase